MSYNNPFYHNDQFDDPDEEHHNLNDDISFNLHSSEQVDDICFDYDDDDEDDDIMLNGYTAGIETNDSLRPTSSGSAAKRMEAATLMTMMHQSNSAPPIDNSGFVPSMISSGPYRDTGASSSSGHNKLHAEQFGTVGPPANSTSAPGSIFPAMIPNMEYYSQRPPSLPPPLPPPLRTIQYASAGNSTTNHHPASFSNEAAHSTTNHHSTSFSNEAAPPPPHRSGNVTMPNFDMHMSDRHHHHHHHHLAASPPAAPPSNSTGGTGRGRGRGGRGGRGRGAASKKAPTSTPHQLNIPNQLNLPVYTGYISLGSEEDKYWLSELQCYLRSHFAESFGASEKDIAAPMHGRNKPVSLGQVGIRCMHCRDDPVVERGQQAVSYPSLISGIYNSVQTMLRMHFDSCLAMPPDIRRKIEQLRQSASSRGGRKQYWMDSAKRLGLIDTTHGIYFARDPENTPLPPLPPPITSSSRGKNANSKSGMSPLNNPLDENISMNKPNKSSAAIKKSRGNRKSEAITKHEIVPAIITSEPDITTTASIDPDDTDLPIVPSKPAFPLVLPEDQPLICDYLYLTLEQMQPANLMQADRVGCYKAREIGFPGLACKHCVGQAGCGRYFPASEASLSQTTTSQTILNHVRNCRRCPIEIRESLELMKRAKLGPDGKKSEKPKHGGRKVFFRRLWCRIQGLPMEEEEEDLHADDLHDEVDHDKKKKPVKRQQKNPRQKKVAKPPKRINNKKNIADKEDDSHHSALTSSVASSSAAVSTEDDNESSAASSSTGDNTSDSSSCSESSDCESELESDDASSSSSDAGSDGGEDGIILAQCGLCKSDDSLFLPDLQCYLRSTMIEVYSVLQDEVDEENSNLPDGIEEGNIGIRCIFCAKSDKPSKGHIHYPMSINNIYTISNDLQRRHFPNCSHMPDDVKQTFKALKTSTLVTKTFNDGSGVDAHQYWVDAAKDLGLTNCSITGSGVVYRRDPTIPSPADMLTLNSSKSASANKVDLIQPSDKGQITDFTILLMKQVRPCYFTQKDVRKGLPVSKDRQIGFPGVACKYCSNSKEQQNQKSGGAGNSIGRYFPSSAKSLSDSTSQSINTHVLSCSMCPDDIKASLNYLAHRSLLQKSELSSGWKRMFYKRVWSRLHDHYAINVTTSAASSKKNNSTKKSATKSLKDRPRLSNPYPTFASSTPKNISHSVSDTAASTQAKIVVDTKEDITSEAFESEVGDVIDAAALWLSEHDKVSTPTPSVPVVRTRNTTKRLAPSLAGSGAASSSAFTIPKSGRGASLPTQKRRRGVAVSKDT